MMARHVKIVDLKLGRVLPLFVVLFGTKINSPTCRPSVSLGHSSVPLFDIHSNMCVLILAEHCSICCTSWANQTLLYEERHCTHSAPSLLLPNINRIGDA